MPENRGILGPMTVQENVDLGASSRPSVARADIEADFDSVMTLFPRREEWLSAQTAGSLSGGEH